MLYNTTRESCVKTEIKHINVNIFASLFNEVNLRKNILPRRKPEGGQKYVSVNPW